jgi:hypothetical protein
MTESPHRSLTEGENWGGPGIITDGPDMICRSDESKIVLGDYVIEPRRGRIYRYCECGKTIVMTWGGCNE